MKALTKHRELIFNDLKERKDHPTAKMVFESVRGKADKISFATVYNSLEYLVEHKMVNKLNIESDSVRYDAFLDDHSHLLCSDCGKILDVPPLKLSADTDWQGLGFQVKHVDIVVSGICSSCHS
ncbi:Fur family transcriptional regulator [Leptospira meyeri]|uniref:Fur family peroxide stress response transcriptional regulator n=1 Tax=Leptospira meyeri TaxID=29508 RepID=A0A4R8MUD6_LEPME|nr:transcriptional repressor [Leptospira meyeri]PKA23861.1 transcriptional repressor [Leptospira sp. mixed culture ATI2-C-A1]EKJ88642.1 ferric uptake regulator family protein [Leptospira meyeri serovar Hardjo str. Went 5]EMJ86611.1 ferric uptake regulator family protein [Leptospira meyeri serovar Semaranga str. Veldrot Semarang 173]MCW7490517.1 transcriptional repressor [Leptospira meyeri]PJZ79525.1 transcriptional repressor [Leptospira meyeri]